MSSRNSLTILFIIMILSFVLLTSYTENHDPRNNDEDVAEEELLDESMISFLDTQEYELKVGVSVSDEEFESLQSMNEQYEDMYQNIHINWVRIPSEQAYSQMLRATSYSSEQLDIVLLNNEWVYAFATSGFLAPLDEQTEQRLEGRIPSSANVQLVWNDYVWAIPMEIDPVILIYNSRVLEEYQWPIASTMEELWAQHVQLSAQDTLSDTEKPIYGLYFNPEDMYAFSALMWSYGGLHEDDDLHTWLENEDHMVTLASLFMRKSEEVMEGSELQTVELWDPSGLYPLEESSFQSWDLLQSDQMAYRIARLSEFMIDEQESTLEVTLLPSKGAVGEASLWSGGRSWSVTSASNVKEQAIHWMLFMTQDERQLKWANTAGTLPAAESALLSGKTGWPVTLVEPWFHEGLTLSPTPDFWQREHTFASEIRRLWTGQEEPEWEVLKKTIRQGWSPANSLLP